MFVNFQEQKPLVVLCLDWGEAVNLRDNLKVVLRELSAMSRQSTGAPDCLHLETVYRKLANALDKEV